MSVSTRSTRRGLSIHLTGDHANAFFKAAIADTAQLVPSAPAQGTPQMKSYEGLARVAYEAHRQAIAKHLQPVLPAWSALAPEWQGCWVEAVKAVAAEIATVQ